MTEDEWLAATDPSDLWDWLGRTGESTLRKRQLADVACVRRIWHLLNHPGSRRAVEVVEALAEDITQDNWWKPNADRDEAKQQAEQARDRAREQAWDRAKRDSGLDGNYESYSNAAEAVYALLASNDNPYTCWHAAQAQGQFDLSKRESKVNEDLAEQIREDATQGEMAKQCVLFRDVFSYPFRHVSFSADWRSPTVTSLAQAVYDDRHLPFGLFDNRRLAVLADALEEAGCGNGDILGHLRNGGEHVRGCWAVDLILGKE